MFGPDAQREDQNEHVGHQPPVQMTSPSSGDQHQGVSVSSSTAGEPKADKNQPDDGGAIGETGLADSSDGAAGTSTRVAAREGAGSGTETYRTNLLRTNASNLVIPVPRPI